MFRLLLVAVAAASVLADDLPPSCERKVYCNSTLLHTIQMNRVFPDSKTFVDLQMKQDEAVTLAAFDKFMNETNNPTKEQLKQFLDEYFESEGELEDWTPPDHSDNPLFIQGIRDKQLKQFGRDINNIWPILGRKVKPVVFEHPERHSLIPVTHGFIIPGGRFKEIYYWDTYWIIEGLLISGMKDTARGMIENLIELLVKLGHIPNGSRWYYQERSQPPLLTAMVSLYYRETNDLKFLRDNIKHLEDELEYWLRTQIVTFEKDDKAFTLLRYYAPSQGPRPESYYEDYTDSRNFSSVDRQTEFFIDIKSGAESGWDFSTRWFIDEKGDNTGHLLDVHTREIVPVDLNAIFTNALQKVAYFQARLGNLRQFAHWSFLAEQWKSTIEQTLWDEEDGIWYDYDMLNHRHRKYFYPSNLAPLWMGAVDKKKVKKHSARVLEYLRDSHGLDYPGGVPSSLINSGEQWDFPNAWPPLISIVVNALEALGTEEAEKTAFKVAQTWVRVCLKGFKDNKQMFEKYDAEQPGKFGGGGEYNVQEGFGWSNGVVLEFLAKYGRRLTADDSSDLDAESSSYESDSRSQ